MFLWFDSPISSKFIFGGLSESVCYFEQFCCDFLLLLLLLKSFLFLAVMWSNIDGWFDFRSHFIWFVVVSQISRALVHSAIKPSELNEWLFPPWSLFMRYSARETGFTSSLRIPFSSWLFIILPLCINHINWSKFKSKIIMIHFFLVKLIFPFLF